MNEFEENDCPSIKDEEEIPGQLSYAEIYAAVALNGEVIITIPKEEVESYPRIL